MPHIAIICPELSGHLNPMTAVARALENRGHRVSFIQRPLSHERLRTAGFNVIPFGESDFPIPVMKEELKTLAGLSGLKALSFTIELFRRRVHAAMRDIPPALAIDPADALLIDETNWEGPLVARAVGLPFITISNALLLQGEPAVPPFYTPWPARSGWLFRLRNRLTYRFTRILARKLLATLNEYRARDGQPPFTRPEDIVSPSLIISQQPKEFDFPRRQAPPQLHYAAPFVDPDVRESIDFPFHRLDPHKPLIYASMGTLQNRQQYIFSTIAAACAPLDVQLVISLGGAADPDSLGPLPGSPIVVKFAPQLALLQRAKLCITHAGLNTALECLAAGVPMVAIPITNDQPGVAARIRHTQTGELLPLKKLTANRLRARVHQVLTDPTYTTHAHRFRSQLANLHGPTMAADLIEQALALVPTVA